MNNKETPDFSTWLLCQSTRDDPVGDLARDFAADTEHDDALDLERILHGPAEEAFERARDEYLRARKADLAYAAAQGFELRSKKKRTA